MRPDFRQLLPDYRLPASLIKDDPLAMKAFQHEWELQKRWLLLMGWSIMTGLLIPLGVMLDLGVIPLPGRSQTLGVAVYLGMVVVMCLMGLVAYYLKKLIDQCGRKPATQEQMQWVAGQIEKGDDIPQSITRGGLIQLLKKEKSG